MSPQYLSPNAAAKISCTSRSAIMRGIESKSLLAIRDNRNRWLIDQKDLDAWTSGRPEQFRTVSETVRSVSDTDDSTIHLERQVAALETEVRLLREREMDLKADRDAWRAAAERRRGWWPFGR